MLVRSLIHFFKDDSGVNSIATIVLFPGSPDPNQVIYMFSSLWGTQQLITVLIYAVVLLRYRNLLPLMYVVLIVEVGFRMIVGCIHPLGNPVGLIAVNAPRRDAAFVPTGLRRNEGLWRAPLPPARSSLIN